MGLLSRLRSRPTSTSSAAPSDASLAGQQPGAPSQPEGDGPVTLKDRTEPGGRGSPDTNQGKTEPMSTTNDDSEGFDTPSLASMNVGANDAQAPAHPAAQAPAPSSGAIGPLGSSGSEAGSGHATGQVQPGGSLPGGEAHHAPGLQGTTPAGEAVSVDVAAGAAAMHTTPVAGGPAGPHGEDTSGSGDAGPSPAAGDGPLAGSSEELPVVQGIRRPDPDGT